MWHIVGDSPSSLQIGNSPPSAYLHTTAAIRNSPEVSVLVGKDFLRHSLDSSDKSSPKSRRQDYGDDEQTHIKLQI